MIVATVSGNLGRDAEVREAGQSSVCSFSVASTAKVKNEKVTTWVRCSLFGRRGEALAQYLTKGQRVCVAGELSTREYQGKTYLELNVQSVELMGGGRREEGGGERRPRTEPKSNGGGGYSDDDYGGGMHDEIPF